MSEEGEPDPELAEIRARRRAEILARQEAGPPADGPSPTPVELTEASFPSFVADHPRVVIDVWAPWCEPCRAMAPVLEALARELAPLVRFGKLNADTEPALASRWNVQAIPTLLLFGDGRLVDRLTGAYPHDMLRDRLRSVYRLRAPPDLEG